MKDFENKVIKLYLNQDNGFYGITGAYINSSNDFVVIENTFTHKIQYVSKFFIRYIEIVRDLKDADFE